MGISYWPCYGARPTHRMDVGRGGISERSDSTRAWNAASFVSGRTGDGPCRLPSTVSAADGANLISKLAPITRWRVNGRRCSSLRPTLSLSLPSPVPRLFFRCFPGGRARLPLSAAVTTSSVYGRRTSRRARQMACDDTASKLYCCLSHAGVAHLSAATSPRTFHLLCLCSSAV